MIACNKEHATIKVENFYLMNIFNSKIDEKKEKNMIYKILSPLHVHRTFNSWVHYTTIDMKKALAFKKCKKSIKKNYTKHM